jgi:hypothetical protein
VGPRAWTGSWTGAPDNPSAANAVSAIIRVIGAASAHGARGRASHNPPVVGSSPTRPTVQSSGSAVKWGCRCPRRQAAKACGVPRFEASPGHAAIPLRGDR